MPLSPAQWNTLAADCRRAFSSVAPPWTDAAAHDPGVTVVDLLAFLVEELALRGPAMDETLRSRVRRLAERASALAESELEGSSAGVPGDCGGALVRVRFGPGMLLGVDDFRAEQHYLLERLRRRNRLLHGAGVVEGLAVTVDSEAQADDGSAARLVVAPGFALDTAGNEILLVEPATLPLPPAVGSAERWLVLTYAERPCRRVPASASADDGPGVDGSVDGMTPTRTAEGFGLALCESRTADALPLARLRRQRGRWRLDPDFEPPHAQR